MPEILGSAMVYRAHCRTSIREVERAHVLPLLYTPTSVCQVLRTGRVNAYRSKHTRSCKASLYTGTYTRPVHIRRGHMSRGYTPCTDALGRQLLSGLHGMYKCPRDYITYARAGRDVFTTYARVRVCHYDMSTCLQRKHGYASICTRSVYCCVCVSVRVPTVPAACSTSPRVVTACPSVQVTRRESRLHVSRQVSTCLQAMHDVSPLNCHAVPMFCTARPGASTSRPSSRVWMTWLRACVSVRHVVSTCLHVKMACHVYYVPCSIVRVGSSCVSMPACVRESCARTPRVSAVYVQMICVDVRTS